MIRSLFQLVGEGTKQYLCIPETAVHGTNCLNILLKMKPVLQRFGALLHLPVLELLLCGVRLTIRRRFQVLATAVVLDYHAVKIWKKIKRTGTPCLILNETVLIKGMFKPDDEADLFRNVKIKTEDGTRGMVLGAAKQDCSEPNSPPREGIAKCTFDSMIYMGSIIVMSEWIKIEVPRISNQPMEALEPSNSVWQSMDSVEETQKKLDGTLDCKTHVLVIHENRIAAEDLRKKLTGYFSDKLKYGVVQTRGTLEQQRAVIFSQPMPSGWDSELHKKVLNELHKKHHTMTGRGLITTLVSRKPGLRADKEVSTGKAGALGF
ncbi:hypothetical protein C5167_018985 [Papaver somniferum]|uniref:Ribosome biogenesis protein BMS1/TSR1 C-terminal domain-containing protein n=1 Tax=Papaver somniferum TaxID=3469 RepID=A0A4Y7IS81_PAPSO|nr:hypothetical protein C5167_018985 [Papaver somniferum]